MRMNKSKKSELNQLYNSFNKNKLYILLLFTCFAFFFLSNLKSIIRFYDSKSKVNICKYFAQPNSKHNRILTEKD